MTFTKFRWALAVVVAALLVAATVLELSWLIAVAVVTMAVTLSWERSRSRRRRRGEPVPPERIGR